MLNIKNIVISIIILMLLTGCGTITAPQPTSTNLHYLPWPKRQQQLHTLTDWNIRGSLSITYNNRTDIASFTWQKKTG